MAKTRTSFKKGEIHNPNGRPPKEWTWSGLVREAMDEAEEDGYQVKKRVIRALMDKAKTGDVLAIKEIGNRIDGLPAQTTILKGDEDAPVAINLDIK